MINELFLVKHLNFMDKNYLISKFKSQCLFWIAVLGKDLIIISFINVN